MARRYELSGAQWCRMFHPLWQCWRPWDEPARTIGCLPLSVGVAIGREPGAIFPSGTANGRASTNVCDNVIQLSANFTLLCDVVNFCVAKERSPINAPGVSRETPARPAGSARG